MTFVRFKHPFRTALRLLPVHQAVLLCGIYIFRTSRDSIEHLYLTIRNGGHWYGIADDFGVIINTGDGPWIGYQTLGVSLNHLDNYLKKVFRVDSTDVANIYDLLPHTRLVGFSDLNTTQESCYVRFECGCVEESSSRIKDPTIRLCSKHQRLWDRWPQLEKRNFPGNHFSLSARNVVEIISHHRNGKKPLTDTDMSELISILARDSREGSRAGAIFYLECILQELLKKDPRTPMPSWVTELVRLPCSFRKISEVTVAKHCFARLGSQFKETLWLRELIVDFGRACRWPLIRCHIFAGLGYFLLATLIAVIWQWHVPDWKTFVSLTATLGLGYLGWKWYTYMWE